MHLKENSQRLAGGCDMQGERLTYSGTIQYHMAGILLFTEGHLDGRTAPLQALLEKPSYPLRGTH